jgi:hypothetical protein
VVFGTQSVVRLRQETCASWPPATPISTQEAVVQLAASGQQASQTAGPVAPFFSDMAPYRATLRCLSQLLPQARPALSPPAHLPSTVVRRAAQVLRFCLGASSPFLNFSRVGSSINWCSAAFFSCLLPSFLACCHGVVWLAGRARFEAAKVVKRGTETEE